MKYLQYIVLLLTLVIFSGCGIGSLVAAPFHITGSLVNIVAPDVVGNSISTVGSAADAAIPF
ncbi:MAG: hypothetical protein GQ570_07250 [Helicobacteraceae bacterium]|nr:hypothetical protein [Helicobacteraceae bacterium]